MNRRLGGALLVGGLVLARVAVVPIFLDQQATRGPHVLLTGDVRRFQQIAESRREPYRQMAVEYPPLTLAAIDLITGPDTRATTIRLMWSQLLLDLAIAVLVGWGWGRRAAIAYLLIGLPFVAYPFIYLRLDLLSVFLSVLGGVLVRRRREVLGGTTLALACFAKPWPLAVVPVLFLRRQWRATVAVATTGCLGLAAWVAWSGPAGIRQVLTFRGARGWEIESLVGVFVHALSRQPAIMEKGAVRVGDVSDAARIALGLLLVGSVAAVWWLASRLPNRSTLFVDGIAPVGAVAAVLLFSPLLSPQYACWLVPYAAIAAARGAPRFGVLVVAIVALSTLDLFLVHQVTAGDAGALAVVFTRNALLVVVLVLGVAALAWGGGLRFSSPRRSVRRSADRGAVRTA